MPDFNSFVIHSHPLILKNSSTYSEGPLHRPAVTGPQVAKPYNK